MEIETEPTQSLTNRKKTKMAIKLIKFWKEQRGTLSPIEPSAICNWLSHKDNQEFCFAKKLWNGTTVEV